MPDFEVGFPDRSWGPPREHDIVPYEPPVVEGEYREVPEEEEILEETEEERRSRESGDWARQEAWEMKEARRAELHELYAEALSLGAPTQVIDRMFALGDIAGLRRVINKIKSGEELDLFGARKKIVDLEKQQWVFKQEREKAKREKLGRIGSGIKKTFLPGRGKTDIYFPKKMPVRPGQPAFGAPSVRTVPAAQLMEPQYGALRQEGTFHGTMPHPTGDISPLRQGMRMGMERELVLPPGWTRAMGYAYREIRANGDVDSPAHVVSELLQLGIPKAEAIKAISNLIAKGLVEKVKDKDFPGEPVLQITEGKR